MANLMPLVHQARRFAGLEKDDGRNQADPGPVPSG
mgnify:CR=1 FL=1